MKEVSSSGATLSTWPGRRQLTAGGIDEGGTARGRRMDAKG
jgi:hypothetical protein